MSVSIHWIIKTEKQHPSFHCGTSSDLEVLKETFGGECSTDDIKTLRAMHRTSNLDKSLWSEIADKLESVQGSDYERKLTLEIWGEW